TFLSIFSIYKGDKYYIFLTDFFRHHINLCVRYVRVYEKSNLACGALLCFVPISDYTKCRFIYDGCSFINRAESSFYVFFNVCWRFAEQCRGRYTDNNTSVSGYFYYHLCSRWKESKAIQ